MMSEKSERGMASVPRNRMTGGIAGVVRHGLLAAAVVLAVGCSLDGILGSDELPPEVTDPAITKTPEGAVAAYHGLIEQFRRAFAGSYHANASSVAGISGLFSDELQIGGSTLGRDSDAVDSRVVPEGEEITPVLSAYSKLQRVRGQASQAIGLLTHYAPEQRALTAHAYVMQAYAEIFLAELFCSGVPLSTLDFEGDYTLRAGSTTEDVYEHALVLLDSAVALSADSVRFVHLARMAQARALLGLGRIADAADAAAQVPDAFVHSVTYIAGSSESSSFSRAPFSAAWDLSVADQEGLNGLPFRSSGDPRAASIRQTTNTNGWAIYMPVKYAADGSTPVMLASAVEARLIEAEADLQAGGTQWLTILNALRTNGEVVRTYERLDQRGISTGAGAPQAGSPGPAGVIDTTWGPGTGIGLIPASVQADVGPVCAASASPGTVCTDTVWYKGLAPLADPGTPASRIDLLFRERAYWLFLTGHRQADLRRLIARYGRSADQIYPIGAYPAVGHSYGSDVTLPVPAEEGVSNPHFAGCLSRDA